MRIFLGTTTLICIHVISALSSGIAAEKPAASNYADLVLKNKPVAYWRFEKAAPLNNSAAASSPELEFAAEVDGNLEFEKPGANPSEFTVFKKPHHATKFTGQKGFIRVTDPGDDSPLDFKQGDSITMEAWVNPEPSTSHGYYYILSKGRTHNKGFSSTNNNYTFRLKRVGSTARLSFLFHSTGEKSDWHRWTSNQSFAIGNGWHHVAISYTFGQPKSLRGYIDGKVVKGRWDMGGATDKAPVVDNDELWIGSTMGGLTTNSFLGSVDEIAIYRTALKKEQLQTHYKFKPRPLPIDLTKIPKNGLLIELFEKIPDNKSWTFRSPELTESYTSSTFAFVGVPKKYSGKGLQIDRSNPFMLRALGYVTLPEGSQRILIRCRNGSRLYLDNKLIGSTKFHSISGSAHGKVFNVKYDLAPNIRALHRGDTESVIDIQGDGKQHLLRFEMIVGGSGHRPELGETSISIAAAGEDFRLLTAGRSPSSKENTYFLTDEGWLAFARKQRRELVELNRLRRSDASANVREYWQNRHQQARDYIATQPKLSIPDKTHPEATLNAIDLFINQKLSTAKQQPDKLIDDMAFLRRVSIDITGTIPSQSQIKQFLADNADSRRKNVIDRLLENPRWADNWVGYWQDVLAENPNIIKPTLNNTGPFRYWIHESFLDNKPFDQLVTELVMMEGSKYYGGPAGFEMASQNDVPMAAKAHVVGQAFLGLEMKCARCHDAPFHDFDQRDLFSMAAMFKRGPQAVPKSSTIPGGANVAESLLVEVTLKPGEQIKPTWTFQDLIDQNIPQEILHNPKDTREQLAALITSPRNERFAKVIVNRLWHRYLGRGIVEPVHDWSDPEISHPELLAYLARELVAHDYDLKHIARLIFNSHTYQRKATGPEAVKMEESYLFAAPLQRKMQAEQIVDSLFKSAEKPFDAGKLTMDLDTSLKESIALNLGEPTRAWEFTSLSNERDRPSLSLPFAQPFVTFLETFGWRSSRQDPKTEREQEATPRQPAVLANGVLARRITRLSDDHQLTERALQSQPVESLIDDVYLTLLTRKPNQEERKAFVALLKQGYADRVNPNAPVTKPPKLPRNQVSWSNHLSPRANEIKIELQRAIEAGDPATKRLKADWRERMEDMIWVLINSPEFVFIP